MASWSKINTLFKFTHKSSLYSLNFTLPISKVGSVYCNYNNASYKEADRLSYKEYRLTSASKLTSPTKNYPIYNISYIETNFEQTIALDSYPGGSLLNFPADSNISINNGIYNKTQGIDYGTVNSVLSTTPGGETVCSPPKAKAAVKSPEPPIPNLIVFISFTSVQLVPFQDSVFIE